MTEIDKNIHEIIEDYLADDISSEQREELNEWLNEKENQTVFRRYIRSYNSIRNSVLWDKIELEKAKANKKIKILSRRNFIRWIAVASVFLGIGLFTLLLLKTDKEPLLVSTVLSDKNATKPILSFNYGEEFVIDTITRIQVSPNIFIPVENNSLNLTEINVDNLSSSEIIKLSIPNGCEFLLTLSDSTKVLLNSESVIEFPVYFSGDRREVLLIGEGYFDVTKNKDAPFIVNCKEMELEVLGTTFNIKAYKDEEEITTTLLSGSVKLNYTNVEDEIILEPSKYITYNYQTNQISTGVADIEEITAWTNGKIIARDRSLEYIMKLLSRWYDFDVVYSSPELKNINFFINVKRYENIESILEKIEMTNGINFTYKDNTIYVSKK